MYSSLPYPRSSFDANDRSRIMGFLGFVYKYEVMGESVPTLKWYAQTSLMLKFIAFLVHVREAGVVSADGCPLSW